MNPALADILRPAYYPCNAFATVCKCMRWKPESGYIPRGFLGANGELGEVELVLVFSEPGDPQPDEKHSDIESVLRAAYFYHSSKRDQFHRNVGYILNLCWPHLSFEEQLRKVWLTESVLCSAPTEGGSVPRTVEVTCGERYLKRQLDLFPHALVVALGSKAQRRLDAIGFRRYLGASAVAPPGCNRPCAKASWDLIPIEMAKQHGRFHAMTLAPSSTALTAGAVGHGNAGQVRASRPRESDDLTGPYQVVDSGRLRATEESDPGKWSIWQKIWTCRSFEELATVCPVAARTRTNRRITWQTEARWALQRGWIQKI